MLYYFILWSLTMSDVQNNQGSQAEHSVPSEPLSACSVSEPCSASEPCTACLWEDINNKYSRVCDMLDVLSDQIYNMSGADPDHNKCFCSWESARELANKCYEFIQNPNVPIETVRESLLGAECATNTACEIYKLLE